MRWGVVPSDPPDTQGCAGIEPPRHDLPWPVHRHFMPAAIGAARLVTFLPAQVLGQVNASDTESRRARSTVTAAVSVRPGLM